MRPVRRRTTCLTLARRQLRHRHRRTTSSTLATLCHRAPAPPAATTTRTRSASLCRHRQRRLPTSFPLTTLPHSRRWQELLLLLLPRLRPPRRRRPRRSATCCPCEVVVKPCSTPPPTFVVCVIHRQRVRVAKERKCFRHVLLLAAAAVVVATANARVERPPTAQHHRDNVADNKAEGDKCNLQLHPLPPKGAGNLTSSLPKDVRVVGKLVSLEQKVVDRVAASDHRVDGGRHAIAYFVHVRLHRRDGGRRTGI
mmetsp:Transcript_11925/g.37954  ORF Transcript_11925/g.37954 Transcript_11925/m.37954 type:complete len:254 (+) Transcript_11925:47-808(+)